jgi:hypothetical protein
MPGIWKHFEDAGNAPDYRPVRFIAWITGTDSDATRYAVALMGENHFGWVQVHACTEQQGRFWDILGRSSGGWYGTRDEATANVRAAVARMLDEKEKRTAATDVCVKRVGQRLSSRGLGSESLALFSCCYGGPDRFPYDALGGADDALAERVLDEIARWQSGASASGSIRFQHKS